MKELLLDKAYISWNCSTDCIEVQRSNGTDNTKILTSDLLSWECGKHLQRKHTAMLFH